MQHACTIVLCRFIFCYAYVYLHNILKFNTCQTWATLLTLGKYYLNARSFLVHRHSCEASRYAEKRGCEVFDVYLYPYKKKTYSRHGSCICLQSSVENTRISLECTWITHSLTQTNYLQEKKSCNSIGNSRPKTQALVICKKKKHHTSKIKRRMIDQTTASSWIFKKKKNFFTIQC